MKKNSVLLKKKNKVNHANIVLPSSKSISNRALIIDALAGKNVSFLHNLSPARDTQLMIKLLSSSDETLNVIDAGTTMRFLTAYLTIINKQKTLIGTERMEERPIRILVDTLTEIGGKISYLKNKGYPPLKILGFKQNPKTKKIKINGSISSQYISSILMIAPHLEGGIEIELEGKINSKPYIDMTLHVMKAFGIKSDFTNSTIKILPQSYSKGISYTIEPDWSAASYWFSLIAMSNECSVHIKDLKLPSIQGDAKIVEIMKTLGVESKFDSYGLNLKKIQKKEAAFTYDFSDCPDLAPTVIVACVHQKVKAKITGLESLKIKETDRVRALQNELPKIGGELIEYDGFWEVVPFDKKIEIKPFINTYNDHRMAMAFAPIAMQKEIILEDKSVINKSYPSYWDNLGLVGIDTIPC